MDDGPEYARLGAFTQYVGALVAAGALPAVRVALFAPGDRNVWYAAHADYADTLANAVLPRLHQQTPATAHVGVGVSLGALALLHLHRRHSALFDGLFLQSGSFFTPDLDPQERDFAGFAGVTGFVAGVSKGDPLRPGPTVVTCGEPEENYANNRRMVTALDALGFAATFVPRRDAHNYTAWRDALDPYLTDLVHASVVTRAA